MAKCRFCFENPDIAKHLIIAIGLKVTWKVDIYWQTYRLADKLIDYSIDWLTDYPVDGMTQTRLTESASLTNQSIWGMLIERKCLIPSPHTRKESFILVLYWFSACVVRYSGIQVGANVSPTQRHVASSPVRRFHTSPCVGPLDKAHLPAKKKYISPSRI